MSKPFDASAKELLQSHPGSWMGYLGIKPKGPVVAVDSDLATVTSEADKVFRVEESQPWLIHIEIQASQDARMVSRLLRYNVLLNFRHDLPVFSVLVLLRPQADAAGLSGAAVQRLPDGLEYLTFRCKVVRAWERPVEEVLQGGLGTLPMAPLSATPPEAIPSILDRMGERIRDEADPGVAATLWSTAFLLLGLRFTDDEIERFRKGAAQMPFGIYGLEESSVYKALVAKGEAKGEAKGKAEGEIKGKKDLLMELASERFRTPPPPRIAEALDALTDSNSIKLLGKRLLGATRWEDLFEEQ